MNEKSGEFIILYYAMVKNLAVCPPCDKVIKYGDSANVLVKHLQFKACRVSAEIKKLFPISRKRHNANISIPDEGKKKYKQSVLVPLPAVPEFTPERKAMFRRKMLPWDLGVINRDLRPFNFTQGQGMQERDQAL